MSTLSQTIQAQLIQTHGPERAAAFVRERIHYLNEAIAKDEATLLRKTLLKGEGAGSVEPTPAQVVSECGSAGTFLGGCCSRIANYRAALSLLEPIHANLDRAHRGQAA